MPCSEGAERLTLTPSDSLWCMLQSSSSQYSAPLSTVYPSGILCLLQTNRSYGDDTVVIHLTRPVCQCTRSPLSSLHQLCSTFCSIKHGTQSVSSFGDHWHRNENPTSFFFRNIIQMLTHTGDMRFDQSQSAVRFSCCLSLWEIPREMRSSWNHSLIRIFFWSINSTFLNHCLQATCTNKAMGCSQIKLWVN